MKTDVLIVGAGPTGLALACQLIRYGIDFVIIDKKESTTPYSKAIGVQARTLEIYEQIGLAEKLIAEGTRAEAARMIVGGKIRGEIVFGEYGKGMSPYPYFLFVEPLTSMVVAAIILNEQITLVSIFGGAVILFGIWMVNKQ